MTDYYVDPAASGANDGGGDGTPSDPTDPDNWTDAWTSLQSAADTAIAGDEVYCRGTQTLTAPIDFDTNSGSAASPINYYGCASNGTLGGDYFTLDGDNKTYHGIRTQTNPIEYIHFHDFKFYQCDDAKTTSTTLVDYWFWDHCLFDDNVRAIGDSNYNDYNFFYRCKFQNHDGVTIYRIDNGKFLYCTFYDNAGIVMDAMSSGLKIQGCVFAGNTASRLIYTYSSSTDIDNCIFHGNTNTTQGCIYTGAYPFHHICITNCRFTNNNVVIDNSTYRRYISGCYFQGNTTNVVGYVEDMGGLSVFNGTDTDYGYTDSASRDFNLVDSATLRSTAIELP